MPLDFLILYEHIVREYESITLLRLELERRGYTVDIRQLMDRKKLKYFTWKKPKVLVASNMYDNEGLNSHVYNNVGRLDKVVNLHWEQMLSDTQEAEPWFNFEGNAKQCVQTCWGDATRRRIVARGVPEQNAPVTGAVMMDFLRPEFEGYYEDKAALCAKHGLDPEKPLWLYVSSFGYASMSDAEVKELSAMAGTDFTAFAGVNRASMAETLEWVDEYLGENPEVQFVYRRHPSEWNSPVLTQLSEKHANFHVIFDGGVQQWVTAADSIFIWMSTAIAEVYTAGKTAHIVRPVPIPHEFDPVIYKDARFLTDKAAFLAACRLEKSAYAASASGGLGACAASALTAAAAFPIAPAVLDAYFDESGAPAYLRMADLLEDVLQKPPRGAPFGEGFKPHFNWLKFFALWGVHIFHAFRFDPIRLDKITPGFAAFASRVYGYVDKSCVAKEKRRQVEEKIRPYVERQTPKA